MATKLLLLPIAALGLASDITLVTFDGATTAREWRETNDPVMGGQSTGSFSVNSTSKLGVFDGQVNNVPSLKAPGFIKVQTSDLKAFPDISSCKSMVITSRASAPFAGYRLSFGTKRNLKCSFFSDGYKAKFAAPYNPQSPEKFTRTEIPLTNFSDCNSDATGEPSKTCADDPSVCPDQDTLKDVKSVTIWAEGALGKVHLEVQSISASGCSAAASAAIPVASETDCEAYSKVVDATCAEDCIPSMVGICPRSLIAKEGGLTQSTCASQGYTIANGTTQQKAGPCGTLTFNMFTKPASSALGATANDILVATFDGSSTAYTWTELNDPVMGGESTGNFTQSDGLGKFRGSVVNVPKLKAPGFIKAEAQGSFPDVSSCKSMKLVVRAGEKYDGYRFQFGNKKVFTCSFFSGGFKAKFAVPASEANFTVVEIPLTNFSDCNSDATGEPSKTCADDPSVCPDQDTLKDMKTIAIWAEGAAGTVDLDIQSISGSECTAVAATVVEKKARKPGFNGEDTCSGPVQSNLRYDMSKTIQDTTLPFPLAANESLATGICCDSAYAPYAEPQFTFNRTDVDLFGTLKKAKGPVTFYDSVCGIPLFRAPIGRSFDDFMAETIEHGWPSFRSAEVVDTKNIQILESGAVVSKCGTHLGSSLPDAKGQRYCLDLSCIAGNPN